MDSTSLPYNDDDDDDANDDDEWLDSPPLCGDGSHEGAGVLVPFALDGYL